MLIKQLVDRSVGLRVPALVDLIAESPQGLPGVGPRISTRWDQLAEPVTSLRDGIDARIDGDAQGTARQLLDASRLPLSSPGAARHRPRITRRCPTFGPTACRALTSSATNVLVNPSGPPGDRTPNPRIKSPLLCRLS
jgi:hypothetical protein